MAKFNVLPREMKLYSPAEPNGRVFLAGEQWPGDAWSDQPGGDEVGKGTVTQALKDLEAAQKQADDLRGIVESHAHDLAQATKRADDAVSENVALKAKLADAEKAGGDDGETLKGLTSERDAARADAAEQRERAARLDKDLTEARATIDRIVGELNIANQRAVDAEALVGSTDEEIKALRAEVAKVDRDGDGKVGGSKKTLSLPEKPAPDGKK